VSYFFLRCSRLLLANMRTCNSLVALSLPALTFAKRQLYISRHCVRTGDDDSLLAPYTSHSMPDWGVADGWCTSGGTDIMAKTGKDLIDNFGFDPALVRFISDPMMRDVDTAFYLAMGMGIQHVAIDLDEVLFREPQCEEYAPPTETTAAERRARFDKAPLPFDYKTSLAEMQEIIGVGPAGRLEDIDGPDAGIVLDDQGVIVGAARIMAEFGQVMLYTYASDIPFLNVTEQQVNKFAAWHAWWMNILFVDNSYSVASNAFLMHRILDDLKTASTTNVFAAHDSNIDGIASVLGLKWNASPYAPDETNGELMPTPPGCGLLFEFDDDNAGAITVAFVHRIFDHSDVFKLTRTEVAKFEGISEFEQAIMSGLKKFMGAEECFNKAASPVLV